MLRIVVVDQTAEQRNKLVEHLTSFLNTQNIESHFLPRISLIPLSRQELKFHSAPHICIVGEGLVRHDMTEIGAIRRLFPESALIVRTDSNLESISSIEQLARMGVDDTFACEATPAEPIRKIILHARRVAKKKTGKLFVVDGGKGGVGTTSLVAALGDAFLSRSKRVALLDFDFETQDLSRFLQAKPFVNENLQALFDGNRPITFEFVEQCLVKVWEGEELYCLSPFPENDQVYSPLSSYSRSLLSLLEILDSSFDAVVVDTGSLRGQLLQTIYRVADKVILLLNNDPATLYASVDRVSKIRSLLGPSAELVVVENSTGKAGLSNSLLKAEFNRAAKLTDKNWLGEAIPYCGHGARWPASGATLYSHGKEKLGRVLDKLVTDLGSFEPIPGGVGAIGFIRDQFEGLKKLGREKRVALPLVTAADPEPAALLGLPEQLDIRLVGDAAISPNLRADVGDDNPSLLDELVTGARVCS